MPSAERIPKHIAPSASASSAVAGFFFDTFDHDSQRLALPRPEVQIIVRYGPSARGGLDVHVLGTQPSVRRKHIRAGQRAFAARLHLGASRAVLGVPASALSGRIVALDEVWSRAVVQKLLNRLIEATSTTDAASIMASAIAERLATAKARDAQGALALKAAERLVNAANVDTIATELGVSERHLRRVFRECVGLAPKAFARLARFRRALDLAREDDRLNWATIAASTGYYDQAHLIDEFRTIAGVTPRALLSELGASV